MFKLGYIALAVTSLLAAVAISAVAALAQPAPAAATKKGAAGAPSVHHHAGHQTKFWCPLLNL